MLWMNYLDYFGISLLAFMYNKVRPVYQVLVYLFQGFLIVLGEFYFFPHLCWRMSPLYCFHIKITNTCVQQKKIYQNTLSRVFMLRSKLKAHQKLIPHTFLLFSFQLLTILFFNCSISAVRQRARLSVAQASYIIFISTKCLSRSSETQS